jgi:hypothetical protein
MPATLFYGFPASRAGSTSTPSAITLPCGPDLGAAIHSERVNLCVIGTYARRTISLIIGLSLEQKKMGDPVE